MNPVQEFNERFKMALEVTPMHTKGIKSEWFHAAKAALSLASPISLGVSAKEFAALYRKGLNELTLMDFSILSNNIESKSAKELNMPIDVYCVFMCDNAKHVEEWNASTKILHDDITRVMALEAMKKKGASAEEIGQFIAKTAQA